LIDAVEARFGELTLDLAADATNAIVDCHFGSGSPVATDALAADWRGFDWPGLWWLNPPFAKIAPWVEKCATSGRSIVALLPASVGSEWFASYVLDAADVYFLRPRVTFAGHSQPYPRDLMLAHYSTRRAPATVQSWRWKP
jgi:hypothetical protein